MRRALITSIASLASGCFEDTGRSSVVALFELAPEEYYALPFPNDLRVGTDGTLDVENLPRPAPLIAEYLATFSAEFDGFSTNAPIFFRFSGPIDASSLPLSPEASLAPDASVYLVDVDPASPDRGARRPLRFRFEHAPGEMIGSDWLACLPYPGFPLRPRTKYAAVVTRRVRAEGGSPVTVSPEFSRVIGRSEPDPGLAEARSTYAALGAWLDEPQADERDDVAAAATFTTQDPTALMGRLREVIWRDVPVPILGNLKQVAEHVGYSLLEGVYPAPVFQAGTPPYRFPENGGWMVIDGATGEPLVHHLESFRIGISVPDGPVPPGGWPTVLYAHGTGGDYFSFARDGTASRMAEQGLAVVGIDQVLHGPRNPAGGSPDAAFFNFLNPRAGRDNVRQGALDNFQLVRLVSAMGFEDRGRSHRFDGNRLMFMGHSQGGLTGPPFLAYEPLIRGAVLSGAGGHLTLALLHKKAPVDIAQLVGGIIRDEPLDEFNPMLALVQMFIEPADPINYGRLLVTAPPSGVGCKDVYQSEGLIDHYTPAPTIEALGVAIGEAPIAPLLSEVPGFALSGIASLKPPVYGNLNDRTAVFVQYAAPDDSDGHFVVFEVPEARTQHAAFLGTLAREGRATLVAVEP